MLWNSDFLVDRRDGLKLNVNEADLANVAATQGMQGVIAKLLKAGFAPTKYADSLAISFGGASFYRTKYDALIKQGVKPADAKKHAMLEFTEIAQESQQSSRPDKISKEQSQPIGRYILAFANTPQQYARIIKKAILDLKNGRGSRKENLAKIAYYGFLQNAIFSFLQQGLFAMAFDDDENEDTSKKDKAINVANSMLNSLLRGMGLYGATTPDAAREHKRGRREGTAVEMDGDTRVHRMPAESGYDQPYKIVFDIAHLSGGATGSFEVVIYPEWSMQGSQHLRHLVEADVQLRRVRRMSRIAPLN
jgi:hypothetical protein